MKWRECFEPRELLEQRHRALREGHPLSCATLSGGGRWSLPCDCGLDEHLDRVRDGRDAMENDGLGRPALMFHPDAFAMTWQMPRRLELAIPPGQFRFDVIYGVQKVVVPPPRLEVDEPIGWADESVYRRARARLLDWLAGGPQSQQQRTGEEPV